MSYDMRLVNTKTRRSVTIRKSGIRQYGGLVAFNPETGRICDVEEVRFNITYNYGRIFRCSDVLGEDGIRSLYGQSFREIIHRLRHARDVIERIFADQMDIDQRDGKRIVTDDYWKATPRNVIRMIDHMLCVLEVVREQKRSCANMTLEGD